MQSERDYYEVLGIEPSASAEEITEAYHKRAFQYHPDLSNPIKRREYDLPRRYGSKVPKFKKGSKVKISANSPSPYRGHNGFVDKEPVKDAFRFWYMVRIETKGLTTVTRLAEEELEEPHD